MPPTKVRAGTEMLHELERLQSEIRQGWLNQSLPQDWHGLETWAPQPRHRTRVTLRLDSDMVKWFRNTGPGYQARINSVLRIYWLALLSGQVSSYLGEDTTPRILTRARERMQAEQES